MRYIIQDNLGFLVHRLSRDEINEILNSGILGRDIEEQVLDRLDENADIYVMLATDYYRAPWRLGYQAYTENERIEPFCKTIPKYTEVYRI